MNKHKPEVYILSAGFGELGNKEKTLQDIDKAISYYEASIEILKENLKHEKRALKILLNKKKEKL